MSEAARATLALDGDCLVAQVPLRIKRRAGRKEIIVPGGMDSAAAEQVRTNQGLAVTVARAHRWQELLESGRYASIRELALDAGVDNSYLARMLRLTLLAPDIIEAILDGTEPDGLSLEKLYRAPTDWEEQGRMLGFPPGSSTPGHLRAVTP
jgi:hypothetical protein